ncbi:PREDICTED: PLAT domain-containing protein 2-like [Camelina sativa]|uniref:PLAT domain-containing protein 2-like n=1 Tax=Camelina sativa TaxID=90675 RepID=A0ABM0WK25_CAMSA|nr:PREDICTED: PLAT domain-containing protein 2-like [Camelina sativa]
MPRRDVLFLSLLLVAATISTVAFAEDEADCVYTFYLRTGSTFKAGTDSIISARIYDKYGDYIGIRNLEAWGGLMGPGYNYYERGNLDIFSGKAPCLPSPICSLNLTSDGSGDHHGWYVNYVEVTTAGVHAKCAYQTFDVEQWLATDTSPYELTAVRNNCPKVSIRESVARVGSEIRKTLSWIV